MHDIGANYLALLRRWAVSARKHLYFPSGSECACCCFGAGDHGHWSMQANTNAMASFAVLSFTCGDEEDVAGLTKDELLNHALALLRFTLNSHKSGAGLACDGQKWGRNWISALCIERMMHGIEAVWDSLSGDDLEMLRGVMVSECDYLLDDYEVAAGIDARAGKNRPESNIWNGILLHRTAQMYPDALRAEEYRARGNSFLMNGISVPEDALDSSMVDGRKVGQWHVGPNFTENYALHHHAYLNVGYMVICLSNIAMMHFSCRASGVEPPEALYHHVPELWRLVRTLTFNDGRLWRIGGDTRTRYTYCQDYAVPAWLMMRDKYSEDCDGLELGWTDIVGKEQSMNADGSFLGGRLRELKAASPVYYFRLESDRAVSMSMGAYWRCKYANFANTSARLERTNPERDWSDAFHGACVSRGGRRAASWVWEASHLPVGQCVPSGSSDLAEWRWNLSGPVAGTGQSNTAAIISHSEYSFEGGFSTLGKLSWRSDRHAAEGQASYETAVGDIAAAALPDDCSMLVIQRARTTGRVFIDSIKGIHCNIPNDIFNNSIRNYRASRDEFTLNGLEAGKRLVHTGSTFVDVDGKLCISSIYGIEELLIHRPGRRQACLLKDGEEVQRFGGSLYCDEICWPCITTRKAYEKDCILYDHGFCVSTGSPPLETGRIDTRCKDVRTVFAKFAGGITFVFAANFGIEESVFGIAAPGAYGKTLCGRAPSLDGGNAEFRLKAGGMALCEFRK